MVNSGYPVGWATPSFTHTAANSPVSMKETVGARVFKYTKKGIKNESMLKNDFDLK